MATGSCLGIAMGTMESSSKFKKVVMPFPTTTVAADEEIGQQKQHRRKGFNTRAWLLVSDSGQSRLVEVGRHWIMRRTGLPARDLRALDPMLSYPSSILGRERAIVVNLEHIGAIITAKELLMLQSTNPLVVQFVENLHHRISSGSGNGTSNPHQEMTERDDETGRVKHSTLHPQSPEVGNESTSPSPKAGPFEFRALEACLESACRCLESETQTLEEEAYPALDELTSKISSLNLERVRQIKSRLVAISGRVQKVRDELEHLLDDDNDMAEIYLTEKLASHMDQTSIVEEVHSDELEEDDERDDDSESRNHSQIYTNFKPDVEELEMLLEAYFAQIDGILQKLSGMSEYVDDTEDFINIMLDDKQNQLLQMGVMLSTANMILNAGIVVVGLFGMNIHINLFDGKSIQFWETVSGTVAGCVVLYLIAVGWGKKKKLIAL